MCLESTFRCAQSGVRGNWPWPLSHLTLLREREPHDPWLTPNMHSLEVTEAWCFCKCSLGCCVHLDTCAWRFETLFSNHTLHNFVNRFYTQSYGNICLSHPNMYLAISASVKKKVSNISKSTKTWSTVFNHKNVEPWDQQRLTKMEKRLLTCGFQCIIISNGTQLQSRWLMRIVVSDLGNQSWRLHPFQNLMLFTKAYTAWSLLKPVLLFAITLAAMS